MGAAPGHDALNLAQSYAQRLLADLGHAGSLPAVESEHPALGWARSGLMALTGLADGEPELCPVALTACADGALAALAHLAPEGTFAGLRGSRLLAERAAIAGHGRQGPVSPGGACRLLEAADGWIAVNLTRPDDWALTPAWLEADVAGDWALVAALVHSRPVDELVERGRLLGLAVAADRLPQGAMPTWFRRHSAAAPRRTPVDAAAGARRPRVVDLSSLWAGPLCGHLLQLAGAEVIKVESERRPDGARQGPPAFFDLLNAGKRCVAVDPTTAHGREQMLALLRGADIVIEASRPRALQQLGIDAQVLVREQPRLTWLSITGYGRDEPNAQWVAFGDDAGIAAGLGSLMHELSAERMFCGDAIADPLTGLHAALVAWSGWRDGGAGLVSVALADVVRHCIGFDLPQDPAGRIARWREWSARLRDAAQPAEPPRARAASGRAAALGADTDAVARDWGLAC